MSDGVSERALFCAGQVSVDAFMTAAAPGIGRLLETGCRPASTLLGVARLFHRDTLVEIEATAMR